MVDNLQVCEDIIKARSGMYGFLARVYRLEVDENFLGTVPAFEWDGGDNILQSGIKQLAEYMKTINSGTVLDLARDYARVFLGADLPRLTAAFPYESVYTSSERLMEQEARDEVMKIYFDEGIKRDESYVESEDHLAFELEFMSIMCEKTLKALKSDTKNARSYLKKQTNFINNHLLNWVPLFCEDIEKNAKESFYKAMGKITKGFLKEDLENIEELDKFLSMQN